LHGFNYTSRAIDNCFDPIVLEWWVKHINEFKLKYTTKSIDQITGYSDLAACAKDGYVERTLKWWYDNRFIIKPKFTKKLLLKYIESHSKSDPNYNYLKELI
jgi:hypothetical protein